MVNEWKLFHVLLKNFKLCVIKFEGKLIYAVACRSLLLSAKFCNLNPAILHFSSGIQFQHQIMKQWVLS
jgi:hypothetical protein